MLDDLRDFVSGVFKDWVALMSGLASLVLSVYGAAADPPGGLPSWTFWVTAAVCFFICCFRMWQKAHRKLKPKLEVCEDTQGSNHHRRVRVRNLSDMTVRFGAELVSIDPKPEPEYPIPARLQVTGTQPPHREGEISGRGEAFVDVFLVLDDGNLGLLVANHPVVAPVQVPKESYDIRICVFPLPPFEGEPAFRSFRITPDSSRDEGITFSSV